MIDAKEAAQKAFSYFGDLFQGKFYNFALEEVELSTDENHWLITVGYDPPTTGLAQLTGDASNRRQYKLITIDSETGQVISMKIKSL